MDHIFGNPQEHNVTIIWQPGPEGRGTLSILWSCVLTMILCVWTALHLNVPVPESLEQHSVEEPARLRSLVHGIFKLLAWLVRREVPAWESDNVSKVCGTARGFLRRFVWLLLGLFTPEFVVYTAATQYLDPRKDLQRDDSRFREMFAPNKVQLSATQMHFAAMGGIVIDEKEWPSRLEDKTRRVWYLNPVAVELALFWDPRLGEQIQQKNIEDKSKSNALAKTLVCMQALWFMAQCVSRFAQSLPVTLLELNTFAHCFNALLIYILWWSKPLDVVEPIALRGPSARQFFAWMQCVNDPDLHLFVQTLKDESSSQESTPPDIDSLQSITLSPGEELFHTGLCLNSNSRGTLTLNPTDAERWMLAAPVLHKIPGVRAYPWRIKFWSTHGPSDYPRKPTWKEKHTGDDTIVLVILFGSSIVYGGLHALAWNAPFSNSIEKNLWRIASAIVLGYGPVFFLFIQPLVDKPFRGGAQASLLHSFWTSLLLGGQDLWRRDRRRGKRYAGPSPTRQQSIINELVFRTGCLISYTLNIAFLFARIYLVWESFWGLFHAVPGVFSTPSWIGYFPHL